MNTSPYFVDQAEERPMSTSESGLLDLLCTEMGIDRVLHWKKLYYEPEDPHCANSLFEYRATLRKDQVELVIHILGCR